MHVLPFRVRPRQGAFSWTGAVVALALLGVVATLGVPRFRTMVERGKAAEAFDYLERVQAAQEAYRAENGRFAWNSNDLHLGVGVPTSFWVSGPYSSDWTRDWTMTLTRNGAAGGRGRYTVVWTESGFDAERSTIPDALAPGR